MTLPDGRTEGYTIDTIVKLAGAGGGSAVRVKEEPGLELRDSGKLVKLVFFPHHGLRGALTFVIAGSVHRDASGKVTSTAPLGSAPGSDGGVVALLLLLALGQLVRPRCPGSLLAWRSSRPTAKIAGDCSATSPGADQEATWPAARSPSGPIP